MKAELKNIRSADGQSFRLLRLPMAKPIVDTAGNRLPASYANFLIMNEIVLMPLYGGDADAWAREVLSEAFPGKKIVGINALPLIRQGGSIHCATMQFPEGIL
jgi:agmatine/peptidylarginine deiminase